MVWQETGIMDARLLFIGEVLRHEESVSTLCAACGISRKTGNKWLGRYREFGPEGLHHPPRVPPRHGRATPADVVARIVALKEAHPSWGPELGTQVDHWPAVAAGAVAMLAFGLDDGGDPEAGGPGQPASRALAGGGQRSVAGGGGSRRGVDRRLQGLVQDARRAALRAPDGDGRGEPLSAGAGGDADGRRSRRRAMRLHGRSSSGCFASTACPTASEATTARPSRRRA